MAPKRSTPLDDPPSASSDDDETEDDQLQPKFTDGTNQVSSSSEEEEDEDEEEDEESEEETIVDLKVPLQNPKILNPKVGSSSEGESESESEEEEEEEETPTAVASIEKQKTPTPNSSSVYDFDSDLKSPTASDFAIKPSKKINASETPEKTATSKRPSSESDLKDKKKIKVSNGDVDDEKKSSIKRVWSDEDELWLLQGFIDYQTKKGCSPLSDMDGFYQFTMDSLPGNASRSQLYEKIRRLKKKFLVNSEKASGNGENPVFAKPHELKLFEISKKIWGVGGCERVTGGGSNAKIKIRHSKAKPKIEVKEEEEEEDEDLVMGKKEDFETLYPHLSAALKPDDSNPLSFPVGVLTSLKENPSWFTEAQLKEMDEKWKAIYKKEAVLRKERIVLLGRMAELEMASLGE